MHATSTPIRKAVSGDLPRIERLAVAAGMFPQEHVGFLSEQFKQSELDTDSDSHWLVIEHEGLVVGAAYYAPEPFSDRMWNLYFIVVDPKHHGQGYGRAMMRHVEQTLERRGSAQARTLIVETSSTDQYEGTRKFYRHLGYTHEATIRQFYGPEDDKVVFWKQLSER